MNVPGLKELIGNSMMIFFGMITALYFIATVITTIKNKTKKVTRKQITHRYAKIDLCEYLTSKMKQEYIGQKKVIFNELVRM